MSVEANKQTVLAVLAAMAEGNYDSMLAYLAEDIRFYVIGSTPYSGTFSGKQELLDKILIPMGEQRNEDGYREDILNIIGENDLVVTESRGYKTTKSGAQYNNEYLFIYRLEKGRIKEWRCYLDTELLAGTHD